jgi:hypothetical protein
MGRAQDHPQREIECGCAVTWCFENLPDPVRGKDQKLATRSGRLAEWNRTVLVQSLAVVLSPAKLTK